MIRLMGISKAYHNRGIITKVLDDVSLVINPGEFVAITGRSGCGKTTLMNIVGCIDSCDRGSYFFEDRDVLTLSNREVAKLRNRSIGFVFQAFNLVPEENVIENVAMPLGYAGVGRKERFLLASRVLDRVGILDKAKSRPSQLSGGEQQRVAIARALVIGPKIILADEPTGNLDELNGQHILDMLNELNKRGTTIAMVTHDMTIAKRCDRIITMSDGRIK